MEEEIGDYKFRTACDTLETYINGSRVKSVVEVGAWYGTIAKTVLARCPGLEEYHAYEAVNEIAAHLSQHSDPRLTVYNETVADSSYYRPTFNIVPSSSVSTSGLFTKQSPYTIERPVGPALSAEGLFSRHSHLHDMGLKLTTEGCNLYILHEMFKLRLKPKFLYVQVPGSRTQHFLERYWPSVAQLYHVPVNVIPWLEDKVTLIAVRNSCVVWWSPTPKVAACRVSFGNPLDSIIKTEYVDPNVQEWYVPSKLDENLLRSIPA